MSGAIIVLAATSAGVAVWLSLQPVLGRQLDHSRALRLWQRGVPDAKGDVRRQQWLAAAIIAGVLLGLAGLGWWQALALILAAWNGSGLSATAAARRDEAALSTELPTVWLLFAACQQAGLSLRQSLHVLSDGLTGSAGRRLRAVQTAVASGQSLQQAAQAAGHAGEFRRGWDLLVRAEAMGSPVGPLLRRLAAHAADEQRWQRQALLARLPLWLTLVTVCCFLPGVLIVTVMPQVLSFIAQMR